MALRRLNGRTGHSALALRIEALEQALVPARSSRAAQASAELVWQRFPPALRQYLATAASTNAEHSTFLWRVAADRAGRGEDPLTPSVGWVLRFAVLELGWWHARDLREREVRTSVCYDYTTAQLAAEQLFGVDRDEVLRLWSHDKDGVEWLRLWRTQASRDERVLGHAGLAVGTPERELLDQLGGVSR